MASRFLLRSRPILQIRRIRQQEVKVSFFEPKLYSDSSAAVEPREEAAKSNDEDLKSSAKVPPKFPEILDPETLKRMEVEAEIWKDVKDVKALVKEILHSDKYVCGQRLSKKDEKLVEGKILKYHPDSKEKIGRGIDLIMVDHHPEFEGTKCLFVVRKDGSWSDFSYRKSLLAYIREKYPSYADKFIQSHFSKTIS